MVCWGDDVGAAWEGLGVGRVGTLAGSEAGCCCADGGGLAIVATAAIDEDFHHVAHFEERSGKNGLNEERLAATIFRSWPLKTRSGYEVVLCLVSWSFYQKMDVLAHIGGFWS